ncbi:3-oxoacyl-ACP synthase III family protein [Microbulbifer sp. HZ11]|uniref:3-oxoacyl-ACP synthase III family protein n=1 Tax=unclassified Microbulbifer TaxID=2619833 RepID=UPI0005BDDFDB|nr:3-oxoacyl-ACP synthase III family protein [Microbulbifer sp. HZ11]
MKKAKIASIASQLPARRYKNTDPVFSELPEMSKLWWRFWGIEERGYFSPELGENELTVSLSVLSRLLKANNLKAEDIDLIICAASCPVLTDIGSVKAVNAPRLYPRLSRVLREEAGLTNAMHFDIQMECASFLLGQKLAASFIEQGKVRNAIVLCCEYISNMMDYTDRSSTIFSDGCAATLLTVSDDEGELLASAQHSDATHYTIATGKWRLPSNGCQTAPTKLYFTLDEDGQKQMQEFVPQNVPIAIHRALEKADLKSDKISEFVFHQPSPLLVHAWASGVDCPEEKYLTTMDKAGVMVSASIPYTLHQSLKQARIQKGDTIVMAGAATGWGFAAQVWRVGDIVIC